MAGSDDDRIERLKERLARPTRTREAAIDITAAAIAKRSRALRAGIEVAGDRKRDTEARAEALMTTYGRAIRQATK
ncbi:MAG TPA: hypothetical protein VK867_13295 [Candidatus Limnocylindrales bacterium]|nr:hypothetical protein [Candidatus Limnocylindrales bacterium]